jgi:hypothetical protein
VEDLVETLGLMSNGDAVWFMTKLQMQALQCWLAISGEEMNIEDLACMYGHNEFSAQCGPVKFYGGPELNYDTGLVGCEDHRFKLIESSVLFFVLDAILFRVSQTGLDVFKTLEIPL